MSLDLSGKMRYIPATLASERGWEAFPYFAASYGNPVTEKDDNDSPVAEELCSPEENAQRLASADQLIHQKLQMAEAQAHEIARQAYEEGFASGEAEGRKFGVSQFQVIAERLEHYLDDLSKAANLLSQASKDEVLALSIAIGEYLAGQQVIFSRDGIRDLLEKILARHPTLSDSGEILDVFMNPKDKELLGDRYVDKPGIRLLEDPELSRGSLRMHSPEGVLEATLERRKERLLELIHHFREEKL